MALQCGARQCRGILLEVLLQHNSAQVKFIPQFVRVAVGPLVRCPVVAEQPARPRNRPPAHPPAPLRAGPSRTGPDRGCCCGHFRVPRAAALARPARPTGWVPARAPPRREGRLGRTGPDPGCCCGPAGAEPEWAGRGAAQPERMHACAFTRASSRIPDHCCAHAPARRAIYYGTCQRGILCASNRW